MIEPWVTTAVFEVSKKLRRVRGYAALLALIATWIAAARLPQRRPQRRSHQLGAAPSETKFDNGRDIHELYRQSAGAKEAKEKERRMAVYVWGTDYKQYLQQSSFVGDITAEQRRAAREGVAAIRSSTMEILAGYDAGSRRVEQAQREATDRMIEAQQEMTAALSIDLGRISDELAGLDSTFRWGFNAMLGVLGGMADSLSSLLQIAKTPPAQIAAYGHFEIACDAFRRRLYSDCLESLDKAINGDHTSPGYKLEWRFHQLIGIVRLGFDGFDTCDVDLVVNPGAAERAFVAAARYAGADEPKEAALAMMWAGWAAFVQQKLPEALEHTEAAIALDPKLGEALFQAAKFQMVAGAPATALPVLRQAIDIDRGYVVRAAGDPEFQRHGHELDVFLEALRAEKIADLQRKIRPELAAIERYLSESEEVAGNQTVRIWQRIMGGGDGLLLTDLLGLQVASSAQALREFLEKLRWEYRVRTDVVDVTRDVDEPYDTEEEYTDEVVTRPAGWFRAAVTEAVRGVRTVSKTRRVQRTTKEERAVFVSGLGEVLKMPGGFDASRWAVVPPGRFLREGGEVLLTRGFLMEKTPVTQAQWLAVMGSNPSTFKGTGLPVENVSWLDAISYCNAMSKASGLDAAYLVNGDKVSWKGLDCAGFRLPTEAEWEYACRAGTTGDRYGELDAIAWYSGNSGGKTHPVGRKQPNDVKLYDMLGNVWEWCWDWYDNYPSGLVKDPIGPESGSYRVLRGGSWGSDAEIASASNRRSWPPGYRIGDLGFRLARSLS